MELEQVEGRGLARRRVLGLLGLTAVALATGQAAAGASTAGRAPATLDLASNPASAAARWGGAVPFRRGRAMFGSYLSLHGRTLTQSLALRRRQLGRDQRIVHLYYPWSDYFPAAHPEVPADAVLMISWKGTKLSKITSGARDHHIAKMARLMADMKRPILLRWGWEMNGNWFSWDGVHNGKKPSAYIKAWRRMHRIFRQQGATNVAWVWAPNWNSGPDVSWNKFHHYYPGDAYVDWVGVSGYNFSKESPKRLFSPIVKAYGKRKPIMLAETAAIGHGSHTKARWIRKLSKYVSATPSIGAVVWFDTDTQRGTRRNFRPDTDAEALAAYRAMVRKPRFSG
ncbi:glycosyl hydrolase family 26 [Krasilnikovia cinnamomea]|uniref:Glycosyl hydrolase family 26 n=1 Tax=Krasilnikovia cinnamomea TaxID=349313 RepID=A0A4Q7ZTB9_9ACTN|nr:glycosyl hydrolase [Krasilnikovia cinnamomea]RZU54111.1 glycosyl hydrolase family 26 [Krasilnikovia cinnamomea]